MVIPLRTEQVESACDSHTTAPGLTALSLDTALRALEFIQAYGEVAQRGQGMSPGAMRDAARIFTKADVPAMMHAVLDGRPVSPNDLHQFVVAQLLGG